MMNNREKVEEKKRKLKFRFVFKYTNKKLISKECSEFFFKFYVKLIKNQKIERKSFKEENNNINDYKYLFETDLINSETFNKIYNENNNSILNYYKNKTISSFNFSDVNF